MLDTTTRVIERQTPSNVEAEQAVLGSLLLDGEALTHIIGFLRLAFYLEKHRWIYEGMLNLNERHEPIDFLSVVSALEASRAPQRRWRLRLSHIALEQRSDGRAY